MKILRFLIVIVVLTFCVSCKKSENKKSLEKFDVSDDESNSQLPNKSDIAFYKAFDALKKTEYKLAGANVAHGAHELRLEAKAKG